MFKKVLVIPNSDDADQPVMRRASACVGATTAVAVFDPVYEPLLEGYLGNKEIYEPLRSRVVRERLERAQSLAKTFEERGLKSSAKAVWDHPLAEAIAREVTLQHADVVVTEPMQSRAGSLSHSDWQLVLTCPAPVLVVKSDGKTPYRNIVAAVDPFHAYAKPGDLDAAILAHAKALQALTGAQLAVVHCFTSVSYFGADFSQPPSQDLAFEEGRRQALDSLLNDTGIPISAARLVAGSPHAVLQAMVERGEVDLLVMGALARGRVKSFLIGSTAERVLHHSRADVLVVKPPTP